MDHQAFAQLLGNYGEFFGAIAVVATLIYLAGQLRQNTKALRSSSYDAYNVAAGQALDFTGQHVAELAEIVDSGKPYSELNTQQRLLWATFSYHNFNTMEVTYLHHRAGSMDDSVFEGRLGGFRVAMGDPLAQEAWSRTRAEYSIEFQNFMDAQIIEQAGSGAAWSRG